MKRDPKQPSTMPIKTPQPVSNPARHLGEPEFFGAEYARWNMSTWGMGN